MRQYERHKEEDAAKNEVTEGIAVLDSEAENLLYAQAAEEEIETFFAEYGDNAERGFDSGRMFRHLEDLVYVLQKHDNLDRLHKVIRGVYYSFVDHPREGGNAHLNVGQTMENFATVYAITGFAPPFEESLLSKDGSFRNDLFQDGGIAVRLFAQICEEGSPIPSREEWDSAYPEKGYPEPILLKELEGDFSISEQAARQAFNRELQHGYYVSLHSISVLAGLKDLIFTSDLHVPEDVQKKITNLAGEAIKRSMRTLERDMQDKMPEEVADQIANHEGINALSDLEKLGIQISQKDRSEAVQVLYDQLLCDRLYNTERSAGNIVVTSPAANALERVTGVAPSYDTTSICKTIIRHDGGELFFDVCDRLSEIAALVKKPLHIDSADAAYFFDQILVNGKNPDRYSNASSYKKVCEDFEKITGVPRHFQLDTWRGFCATKLLQTDTSEDEMKQWEKITSFERQFDPRDVVSAYAKIFSLNERFDIDRIPGRMEQFLSFVKTEPKDMKGPEVYAAMQGAYLEILREKVGRGDPDTKDRLNYFQRLTKIIPLFTLEHAQSVYRQCDTLEKMYTVYQVTGILPDKNDREFIEQAQRIVEARFEQKLFEGDSKGIKQLMDSAREFGVPMNVSGVLAAFEKRILGDPRSMFKMIEGVKKMVASSEESSFLYEFLSRVEKDTWVQMFKKMEKVQAFVERAEHDPWINQLKPLLARCIKDGTLSVSRPEDAEILLSFVGEFGMVNLPHLFAVHADTARTVEMEKLPPKTLQYITEFGVKVKNTQGEWRFKNPRELMNEVHRVISLFRTGLLSGEIPAQLESVLGNEIFQWLKGATQWDRGHKIKELVDVLRTTVLKNPELSERLKKDPEVVFEIPIRVSSRPKNTEGENEAKEKLAALLNSQEMQDGYAPIASALKSALGVENVSSWFRGVKVHAMKTLDGSIRELEELLALSSDSIASYIEKEPDEVKRKALEKRCKALMNPKARQGFDAQLTELRRVLAVFENCDISENRDEQEKSIVQILEIVEGIGKSLPGSGELVRLLSAVHMRMIAPEGWQQSLREHFKEDSIPSSERIEQLALFSRQYLKEHYLQAEQNPEHTGHAPFSQKLFKLMEKVWQLDEGAKGVLPIEMIALKVKRLISGVSEVSRKPVSVTMLPARGIWQVFAPDVGDMCATSKHFELATGVFPGLSAWLYATDRGKPNEVLRGSVFEIQTTTEDGVPALIVRGNNPQQNFIGSIESDRFVIESLRGFIEIAKLRRQQRIEGNPDLPNEARRQYVAIPLDGSSQSSTNRPDVFASHKRFLKEAPRIGLVNTPTTNFNNYNIWNKNGPHPCGKVWEIDENGKETWYGNWKEGVIESKT